MKLIKTTFAGALLFVSVSAFSQQIEVLQGDAKDACTVIMCMAGGNSSSVPECTPSLNKYFSIIGRTARDTTKKRKKFLDLCPTDQQAEDFVKMENLKEIIKSMTNDCTPETLNKIFLQVSEIDNVSSSTKKPVYVIDPNLPKACQQLFNHEYFNQGADKPKYTCNGDNRFTDSGYEAGIQQFYKVTVKNSEDTEHFTYDNDFRGSRYDSKTERPVNRECWK